MVLTNSHGLRHEPGIQSKAKRKPGIVVETPAPCHVSQRWANYEPLLLARMIIIGKQNMNLLENVFPSGNQLLFLNVSWFAQDLCM
jgi:hypothetical protein